MARPIHSKDNKILGVAHRRKVTSFPHQFSPGLFQFLYLHIKRNPLSQHMSSKNFREGQFLEDICWLLNAQGGKYKN